MCVYGLVEDKGTWKIQAKTVFSLFVPSIPRRWNCVNINKVVFPSMSTFTHTTK